MKPFRVQTAEQIRTAAHNARIVANQLMDAALALGRVNELAERSPRKQALINLFAALVDFKSDDELDGILAAVVAIEPFPESVVGADGAPAPTSEN